MQPSKNTHEREVLTCDNNNEGSIFYCEANGLGTIKN